MLKRFFPAALCAAAFALSACSTSPAASPATAMPAATAAPAATAEPAPTAIAAPTAASAAEVPAITQNDPGIQQAVREKLAAEGMTIAYTIIEELHTADAARVQAIPADLSAVDPAWLFLKKEGDTWSVVAGPGTAFPPEDMTDAGLPADFAPGVDDNSAATIEQAVRGKLTEVGSTGAYTITIEASAGDFVRAKATPTDPTSTDPAWFFVRHQGTAWDVVAGPGTAFAPDDLAAAGIPAELGSLEPAANTTDCDALQAPLAKLLNVDVGISPTSFDQILTGATLQGCQLQASGTGKNFSNFVDVSRQIGTLLTSDGWVIDQQYVADGPTGTLQGYRKGDKLVQVSVDWAPDASANCPTDQPISDCQVAPEQQLYNIQLSIAPNPAS